MLQFSIFKKSTTFHWTPNRVIYSILLVCISISLIKQKVFKIDPNSFDGVFLGFAVLVLFIGLFVKLFGFSKPDALHGELDGFIIFMMDEIIVNKKSIAIADLSKIEITNADYYGKLMPSSRGDFNSSLSNGVGNELRLTYVDGVKETIWYELYYSNDMQRIRKELISYYKAGKMAFDNLADVLGEVNQDEQAALKNEIEKC